MSSKSPLRSPDPPARNFPAPASGKADAAKPAPGRSEFVNRAVFSLIMAYTFQALISAGVVLVLPLVLLIKVMMFYEVMRINVKERKENQVSAVFRFIPYYFLAVTVTVITIFNVRDQLVETWPELQGFFHSFGIISFLAYMAGFVMFVLSLRKGMYRYQMGNFAWMAMTLIFIVAQGSVLTANMLRGMIWFLLPVSCVVHNDIWAYACGKSFGRTPLLRLTEEDPRGIPWRVDHDDCVGLLVRWLPVHVPADDLPQKELHGAAAVRARESVQVREHRSSVLGCYCLRQDSR